MYTEMHELYNDIHFVSNTDCWNQFLKKNCSENPSKNDSLANVTFTIHFLDMCGDLSNYSSSKLIY